MNPGFHDRHRAAPCQEQECHLLPLQAALSILHCPPRPAWTPGLGEAAPADSTSETSRARNSRTASGPGRPLDAQEATFATMDISKFVFVFCLMSTPPASPSRPRPGWAPDPLMVGIRSPDGLVVGSCTSHPGVLGPIPNERNHTAGHTVRTQHGVTASAGQRRGDVELRSYLQDAAGRRSLVFDLSMTHDRFGSSNHVQQNGLLSNPQDLDAPLRLAA
jgi:hypothetical protein